MIARMWHGWTKPENADAYENLLREEMFPEIRRIEGARGAYLLRRPRNEVTGQEPRLASKSGTRTWGTDGEVEFVTITLFDSLDAVRRFAGENYATAVLHPKAHALLSRYDAKSEHYEVRIVPE
jgi:hypothetical protein